MSQRIEKVEVGINILCMKGTYCRGRSWVSSSATSLGIDSGRRVRRIR